MTTTTNQETLDLLREMRQLKQLNPRTATQEVRIWRIEDALKLHKSQ